MGLLTTKPVAVLQADAELAGDSGVAGGLRRVLGHVDLALLGLGAMVGLGAIALTGYLSARVAGPAVTLAFALAALGCLLAALCFAELAGVLPSSGGPYAWAYATLGELPAWLVAWCLLLEYALGAASVALGWASHVASLAGEMGLVAPVPLDGRPGGGVRALAAALVALLTLALLRGARFAARLNAVLAVAKVVAFAVIVAGGALAVRTEHWTPFVPPATPDGGFGWAGVASATGAVFFAYLGFDALATTGGEARRPRRDVPRAMLLSLGVCAALYVLLALVATGSGRLAAAQGADPLPAVIAVAGGPRVVALVVRVALLVGLTGVSLVLLLAASRVLFALARDRLLPPSLGGVSPSTGAPGAATLAAGGAALVAVLAPMERVGSAVTAGALLVFVAVCASLVVLRRRRPELERPFRVPAGGLVATLGALAAVLLLAMVLRHDAAVVAATLFVGLLPYFAYGQAHSRAGRIAAAER